MPRTQTISCLLVLGLGLGLGGFACDDGADSTGPEDSLREAKIGMTEAIAAAEREVGEGQTVEAEWELGQQGGMFEVELLVGDEVREVKVDPSDGRVVSVERDPEDLAEARAAAARIANAKVSLTDAIAAVERETGGVVFEIEVGERGYALSVLAAAGPIDVVVSMSDGSLLASEPGRSGPEADDDDDDDDDDDNDDDDADNADNATEAKGDDD